MSEYVVTINNKKHSVRILTKDEILIDNKKISVNVSEISRNSYVVRFNNKVFEISANKIERDRFGFLIAGWYFDTKVRTRLQETADELQVSKNKTNHHSTIKAPMPGLLLKMKKTVGERVEHGEPLLVLEAMKMENELHSTASGIIKEIFFKEGQTVEKDSVLLIIE